MKQYFESNDVNHYSLEFPDHHDYSNYDMGQIQKAFASLDSTHKAIITTEKDAVKLEKHRAYILQHKLPVFVLPIEVRFLFDGQSRFDKVVKDFLLEFKV